MIPEAAVDFGENVVKNAGFAGKSADFLRFLRGRTTGGGQADADHIPKTDFAPILCGDSDGSRAAFDGAGHR